MNLNMPPMGISGRYRMVVSSDAEMQDVIEDLEFDNLITDVGMNRWGEINVTSFMASESLFDRVCGRFVVGSGSRVPEFGDTALENPVAYRNVSPDLISHSSNYEDGYSEFVFSKRFPQGAAQGNLSEIGIQSGSASGPLWSRALILDGAGLPTTITVRDTDFLTCFYTLRISIPKEDSVFQVGVDYGDGGVVPTEVTIRPLDANNSNRDGWGLMTAASLNNNSFTRLRFWDGGLSHPTSATATGNSVYSSANQGASILPYEGGSFEKRITQTLSLTQGNDVDLAVAGVYALMGAWQVEFNPPLQKNNTQTMDLTFGYSWARA